MKNQSLQEQLLKAGLINETKVKQAKTQQRKQTKKQRKNKVVVIDEAKQFVQEAKAKQLEKDRLLNEQRNRAAEERQINSQINQLIDLNKLAQDQNGLAYRFTDDNKVKTLYVAADVRRNIIDGKLAIVKFSDQYEVVPAKIAEKIRQRNKQFVIVLFDEKAATKDDDDEYQDFEIPDDLMW